MKFLEELSGGDVFSTGLASPKYFIVSMDFKKGNKDNLRLCISIDNGFGTWLSNGTLVEQIPIFTIDTAGTILAIKETQKPDETTS